MAEDATSNADMTRTTGSRRVTLKTQDGEPMGKMSNDPSCEWRLANGS